MKVIIQAGGKGTRLGKLTKNKPKALVEYNGKPLLFHAFDSFYNAEFIIVGDYKIDVLKKYLKTFASGYKYRIIKASGEGTLSGLSKALTYVNSDEQVVIAWCDIVLNSEVREIPIDKNYAIVSNNNYCRYSMQNDEIKQIPSYTDGIIGLFSFKNKSQLGKLPDSGEFVKYLTNSDIKLTKHRIDSLVEFSIKDKKTRYFNECRVEENKTFFKRATGLEGIRKLQREYRWYEEVAHISNDKFDNVPKNLTWSSDDFEISMDLIKGKHPYEVEDKKKLDSLKDIINTLSKLHSLTTLSLPGIDGVMSTYYTKTVDRLNEVKKLLPKSRILTINGKKCKNPLYRYKEIKKYIIKNLLVDTHVIIHGDPTFSNMMITKQGKKDKVILFDPRAQFGKSLLYGDELYDWAKLYYSVKGNYDNFNKKKFDLSFEKNNVYINVESNGYEFLEREFFNMIDNENIDKIKFIHSLIWLSLTSYYWEDYDCILGAFYLGAYYLEESLK